MQQSDPLSREQIQESRDLFAQLLFSYKLNPRTALYVGYTDDRTNLGVVDDRELFTDDLTQVGRTIFAKVSYAWVP